MDKKQVNTLQNVIIALLSVSAVFLLLQTPLFGELTPSGITAAVGELFTPHSEEAPAGSAELATAYAPVQVVMSNNFVRFGADNVSTGDMFFETVGSFLSEAVDSAQEMGTAGESEFLTQLQLPGLYFDFYSELPLEVLSSRLGASCPSDRAIFVRRCLLSVSDKRVTLYLMDAFSTCYRFSCSVSADALTEYLEMQEGNGAEFAVAFGDEYAHLSPYTLLLSAPSERKMLTVGNPLAELDSTDFLSRAEFNPHTQDRYSESSGTIVILEGQRILRLRNDGTAVYSGGSAEIGSLYRVSDSAHASMTEAITGARALLGELLQRYLGDAALYLHSVETTPSGFRLLFNYSIDGTPVRFSDGTAAAEVVVTDNSITAYTVHARRYQKIENDSLLLPTAQASAVCRTYPGGELTVAYIDSFGETVSAGWVAN